MSGDDILARIVEHKREEVAARRAKQPLATLRRQAESAPALRGFARAVQASRPAIIAEIKRASPSEGVIRADFNAAALARSYQQAGATCLSILTDERFFQGTDRCLQEARAACDLPALRKDFIVDPYQVYEARALGADCLLLIVAALDAAQIADLVHLAHDLRLDVLIEVHGRDELAVALALHEDHVRARSTNESGNILVGINNRDLRSFNVCLETTIDMLDAIPQGVTVVTESGIRTPDDVRRVRAAGVHAFLVGTAFMREADPGLALKRLFGNRALDHDDMELIET